MSSYSFFAKAEPKITVWLPNGRGIKFVDIGSVDGLQTGLWSTNDPGEIQEIRGLIQRGVGGVRELDYEDYLQLKKNPRNSKSQWREDISQASLLAKARSLTPPSPSAPPVAVAKAPPVVPMPEPGARPKVRAAVATPPPPPKKK